MAQPILSRSGFTAWVIAVILLFSLESNAASQANADKNPLLSYDVASIRPADANIGSFQRVISNPSRVARFRATCITVKTLLQIAYGIQDDQIKGGPGWIDTELYNVEARSDSVADMQLRKLSEMDAKLAKRRMLQSILAERFKLRVSIVAQPGSLFALVVAKGGNKLRPSAEPEKGVDAQLLFSLRVDGDTMVFKEATVDFLVEFLSQQMHREIADKTGLSGRYDFNLRYRQDASTDSDASSGEPIGVALQEQLGLKLESYKGLLDVLAIDHVEKPSDN